LLGNLEKWFTLLSIALIKLKSTPKTFEHLRSREILCGRPFSFQYLLSGLEFRELTRYVTHLAQFQEAMKELGEKIMSGPQPGGALQMRPGDHVLISTWQEKTLQDQLPPKEKVIASDVGHSTAVKVQGIDNCIHLCR
jgi:hypothetical protein